MKHCPACGRKANSVEVDDYIIEYICQQIEALALPWYNKFGTNIVSAGDLIKLDCPALDSIKTLPSARGRAIALSKTMLSHALSLPLAIDNETTVEIQIIKQGNKTRYRLVT